MKIAHSMAAALIAGVMAGPVLGEDTYKGDPAHASVGFAISHMVISKVKGSFGEFEATVTLNDDGELASAQADIKVASLDTANTKRDEHLRSPEFFDVDNHPSITFESTGTVMREELKLVQGKLTIHGVTKDVEFPYSIKGPVKDPWGNTKVGFAMNGTINRKDYGLTWSKVLETGGLVVGEEVELIIDVEFAKQ